MAAQTNTTQFDAAAMSERARENMRIVERLSQLVADAMLELHGGDWRVFVDHETPFVLIRLKS